MQLLPHDRLAAVTELMKPLVIVCDAVRFVVAISLIQKDHTPNERIGFRVKFVWRSELVMCHFGLTT